jgi:hypothetical protein
MQHRHRTVAQKQHYSRDTLLIRHDKRRIPYTANRVRDDFHPNPDIMVWIERKTRGPLKTL